MEAMVVPNGSASEAEAEVNANDNVMAEEAISKEEEQEKEQEETDKHAETQPQPQPQPLRYSYGELKAAQSKCTEKAMREVLKECGDLSKPQKEVFRAHVKDLCASVFCMVARQYQPRADERTQVVDEKLVQRLKELEEQCKEKQMKLVDLQQEILSRAIDEVKRSCQIKREDALRLGCKRKSANCSSSEETLKSPLMDDLQVDALAQQHQQTLRTIANVSTRLGSACEDTRSFIQAVECAVKKPRTSVDLAMQTLPSHLVTPPHSKHL